MNSRAIRPGWSLVLAGLWLATGSAAAQNTPIDPKGIAHIPIGIADTLDSLKTFVEPEGIFSPGVGTYGICFWVSDLCCLRGLRGRISSWICDGDR